MIRFAGGRNGGRTPRWYHLLLAPLAVVAMWGACIVAGLSMRRTEQLAHASKVWPSVRGEILESASVDYASGATDRPRINKPIARVRYRYTVDGVTYQGDRLTVNNELASSQVGSGADANVLRSHWYREGDSVQVYYDPNKPSFAVLDPGVLYRNGMSWAFLMAFVLACFGTWLLVMVIRAWLASASPHAEAVEHAANTKQKKMTRRRQRMQHRE